MPDNFLKLVDLEAQRAEIESAIKTVKNALIEERAEFKKFEIVEVFESSGAGSWKVQHSRGLAVIEARFFDSHSGVYYWGQPCTKAGKRIERRRFFDSSKDSIEFRALKPSAK